MSIIEKAAGRLHQHNRKITPQPAPSLPAPETIAAPQPVHPHGGEWRSSNADTKPLLQINLARLQERGMVTPDAGKSRVAEEFRFIKRPLLKHTRERGGNGTNHSNLIMVTSSMPKEGKTFCTINLAMSIAMELDHTVLLVDADVARPSVLNTLGLQAEPGLMELLLGEKQDVGDAILKTNVDTLSIIPAGRNHKNATELLASQAMNNFLDEIASRYPDRIVIFDSPPLLLTSESRVLATRMGQIVLVVEAETTTQHALKDALRKLEACPNVSLVYNKSRGFAEPEYYGYY